MTSPHQASWSSWKANTAVSAAVGSVLEVQSKSSAHRKVDGDFGRPNFQSKSKNRMSATQNVQVARCSWCSLPFHIPPDPNGRISVECGVWSGRSSCGYQNSYQSYLKLYKKNLTVPRDDTWRDMMIPAIQHLPCLLNKFCQSTSFTGSAFSGSVGSSTFSSSGRSCKMPLSCNGGASGGAQTQLKWLHNEILISEWCYSLKLDLFVLRPFLHVHLPNIWSPIRMCCDYPVMSSCTALPPPLWANI